MNNIKVENLKNQRGGTEKISLISVICCIAVVYMHLGWFHDVQPQLTMNWILSLIIEKVFVFAVPVFFMISGTTLLDYTDRYDDISQTEKPLLFLSNPLYWKAPTTQRKERHER